VFRKRALISDEVAAAAKEVWSMDFIFDRVTSGRSLKCLGIIDDGTHEAVTIHPEHALGGDHLVRILSCICHERGHPKIIIGRMSTA